MSVDLASGGASNEPIDQLFKRNPRMRGRFGKQALWREAGKRVDLQKIGLLRLLVDHDVDSRKIARADDFVGAPRQFATFRNKLRREAGLETMLSRVGFVLGFVIE